jgi:solute:Na+ symporter, SSS family
MPNALLFAASESGANRLLTMSAVDYVIVVIYFIVVLGIGFYLKKFAGTGEDFFMAGRKMTAWIAGLSFISANLSSLETMGWSAMAYQYGMLGAHAYLISGAIPILFLAVVMMPFYYICKTHSVPGYLKLRYGESSRSMAGVTFAAMTLLVSGSSMFAMAKILNLLLGWDMNWSILVSSLTVAVYVTLGGLISAVFNEVVQFFLIWLGTLLVPILGLISCGGWDNMMALIKKNVAVIHPTVQNADFSCLWHNLGSFADNPMGIDWIGMLFGQGIAIGFAYWCTDFLQVQRVIVAKDLRAAQNGTIIGAALKMCVPLIVILPGLLGLALLTNPDGSPMVLVPESDPRAITNRTFNDVLPLLMGKYLGPGLLGLGITAMIAGFMSGMAGNVSAFATVFVYDVYRPLMVKKADDKHYLNVGRWCSIIGVLLSIATAYSLFFFSNILEFLQVLLFFFIVPLFGVVIVGMLWKRATPKGGFLGFFLAILFSIGMWVYAHDFPEGYRPQPQIVLGKDTVVSIERAPVSEAVKADPKKSAAEKLDQIVKVVVESGTVTTTNVPVPKDAGAVEVTLPTTAEALFTAVGERHGKAVGINVLAPEVRLVGAKDGELTKFGLTSVPIVVKPGVRVEAKDVTIHFAPASFNPAHAAIIARSPEARPMAVNVYSAIWTLCASIVVTVVVSLFTKPKPDAELKNLVMGLTPLPDEGPCPWYKKPMLWAAVVFTAVVIIDIIFW